MPVTREQILGARSRVMDPELGRSLVELGMVHDVAVDADHVGLPLVYHFGVNEGRLRLTEFVNVTSTAAKRCGLYPRKGTIAPGADADLVLFDPSREVTISAETLHQNCDYTPYEGLRVKGWPRTVLSRGEVIVRDGEFVGKAGRGVYLKRAGPAPGGQ
jgi:dihydropyrimidinase